ncbi:hypothetical protein F01_170026 [Burkholderia cenocepacia]|nr:hypothetical protein F01_170026 [Burkholderia cenocepacia]
MHAGAARPRRAHRRAARCARRRAVRPRDDARADRDRPRCAGVRPLPRRRLRGRDRRRLDDRPRQGHRARKRPADPRDPDDLRRQRNDADLRSHRRRHEAYGQRRARAAEDGDLRSRAHGHAAGRTVGDERPQRDRACGGRALREQRESGHEPRGRGRHSRAGARPARRAPRPGRSRRARPGALRRVAVRDGARQRRHGATPQALPYARRQLRSAARTDPHGRAAACARIQRGARAGRDAADRPRDRHGRRRARPLRAGTRQRRADLVEGDRHAGSRPRPRRRPRGRESVLEPAPDRTRRPARAAAGCVRRQPARLDATLSANTRQTNKRNRHGDNPHEYRIERARRAHRRTL